jgi:hypothetical protein
VIALPPIQFDRTNRRARGHNVFGTAAAFWQNRINALKLNVARRMQ